MQNGDFMEQNQLKNQLIDIICQIVDVDKDCISLETDLSQMGIDSIGLLTAICLIEDAYGIFLKTEDLFQVRTFEELITFIGQQIQSLEG